MEAKKRTIEIYEQVDGKRPFETWLSDLKDPMSRARIRSRIDKVETGNFGDFRSVGDGVSELRFTFGAGFRVYYGLKGETIVILLIGGDKSSQEKDIEKAKEFWADYRERENE
jgi:putative addiction module killer protein